MTTTVYRYYAAVHAPESVPAFVQHVGAIVAKMIAANYDAAFLAKVSGHVTDLADAEKATHKGNPAETADRNAKLVLVRSDVRQLKAMVQGRADADIPNAKVIIENAGMSVVKKVVRTKAELAAKHGKVPTTADLLAKASKRRASYDWQMSSDQQQWVDLPRTVKAATSVTGLTPGAIYFFRFRTLTAAGLSDWSAPIQLIAH